MADLTAPSHCLVCRTASPRYFLKVAERDYWQCDTCQARFLEPNQRLQPDREHKHYLTHENDPDDAAYRKFLSKLTDPLKSRLSPGLNGLDYGCGPGPALAAILRAAGHTMALYDPFFFADREPLSHQYDFITCTETIEHFHNPADEFERFDSMLRPGGFLGVMTSFHMDDAMFADWHYVKDPTHVVFYQEATMHHISSLLGWSIEMPVQNVAIMKKPATKCS